MPSSGAMSPASTTPRVQAERPFAWTLSAPPSLAKKDGFIQKVRIGILGNDLNDCIAPTAFIGVGNGRSFAADCAVGNFGAFDEGPKHAAVLVRSNDLTDDSVGTRSSCAAHDAAGYVVDGFYLVGGVRTFCDLP